MTVGTVSDIILSRAQGADRLIGTIMWSIAAHIALFAFIIFMVAAPMLQRGVEVNLPVASRSQEIASDRIFVNVPLSFREDRRVFIGQDPVRVDVLTERMRQLMVNRTDRQVFLRGDGAVALQELLDIMDRLKAAGVEKVGIVSKLPGEE